MKSTPTIETFRYPNGRFYACLLVPGGVSWECRNLRRTLARARADGLALRKLVRRARVEKGR